MGPLPSPLLLRSVRTAPTSACRFLRSCATTCRRVTPFTAPPPKMSRSTCGGSRRARSRASHRSSPFRTGRALPLDTTTEIRRPAPEARRNSRLPASPPLQAFRPARRYRACAMAEKGESASRGASVAHGLAPSSETGLEARTHGATQRVVCDVR